MRRGPMANSLDGFFTRSTTLAQATLDDEGRVLSCNPLLLRLLALAEAPRGRMLVEFRVSGDPALFGAPSTAEILPAVVRFRRLDGGEFALRASLVRLPVGSWFIGERVEADDADVAARLSEMNLELLQVSRALQKRNVELEQARGTIRSLSGLLPICAHCKKIRDDTGYWNQMEAYIHDHAEVDFSHSICPDCLKEQYPELYSDES